MDSRLREHVVDEAESCLHVAGAPAPADLEGAAALAPSPNTRVPRLGLSCQRENEPRSDEQCRCEPVDTQCL
jgi:hypothetical protein